MKRKIIIEHTKDGWMLMDEKGNIYVYLTAEEAFEAVNKQDKKLCKNILVTEIEWRNCPKDFKIPRG